MTHFILTSLPVAPWGYKMFSIICAVILRIIHLGMVGLYKPSMAEERKYKKKETNGKCHASIFLTVPSAQAAVVTTAVSLKGPAPLETGITGLSLRALP